MEESFAPLLLPSNVHESPLFAKEWSRLAPSSSFFMPFPPALPVSPMGLLPPLFAPVGLSLTPLATLPTPSAPVSAELESMLVADALSALADIASSSDPNQKTLPSTPPPSSTGVLPSFSSTFDSNSQRQLLVSKDESDATGDLYIADAEEEEDTKGTNDPSTERDEVSSEFPKRSLQNVEESEVKDLSSVVMRIVSENLKGKDAHGGVGIYRCRECARRFDTEAELSAHKAIHNKGKNFACPHCDYRSKTNNALEKHLLTHSKQKLFNCSLCPYGTNYKDHFEGHMREHKGIKAFACDQCDFKCNRKSHMNRHKLTHSAKKPFNCTLCGYSANRKEHLETHMYKHSGVKPFQCPHCQFACSDQHYMSRHIRTSH